MKGIELVLPVLQAAINRYLHLDPHVDYLLTELAGKTVAVELRGITSKVYLVFTATKVDVLSHIEYLPDVALRGTPFALVKKAMQLAKRDEKTTNPSFFAQDLEVIGDVHVAEQVKNLFDKLDIEWEDVFAKLLGDIPGHWLGRLIKGASQWISATLQTLRKQTVDYVQEEKHWLPHKLEIEKFYDDVQVLMMDVDRLAARVERLCSKS